MEEPQGTSWTMGTVGCPSTLGIGGCCPKAVGAGGEGGPHWDTGVSPCVGGDGQPLPMSESPGKGPEGPSGAGAAAGTGGDSPATMGNDACLGEA